MHPGTAIQRSYTILKGIRGSRLWLLCTIGLSIGGGLLVIPQSLLFSAMITLIPAHALSGPTIISTWWWLGVVIVVRGMCQFGWERSGLHVGELVKQRLRKDLLDRLFRMEETEVHRTSLGNWIQTLDSDIETIGPLYRQVLPQTLTAVIVPCVILITLVWVDWISTVILLITLPLLIFFLGLFGWLAKSRTDRQFRAIHQLGSHFYDVMSGLTVLKWFNRSKAQGKTVAKVGNAYRKATMETLKIAFLSSLSMELISTLGTAMVAVGAGIRLLNDALSYTDALTAIMLTGEFYTPLRAFSGQFHASMRGLTGLEHIDSILNPLTGLNFPSFTNTLTYIDQISHNRVPDTHVGDQTPIIRLENVTFRYPEGKTVLDHACMSVQAGERISVIGPSGSGKSTLFSILLGLNLPQTGTVYAFGEPLREQSLPVWRRKVAYVGPHPHIFSGSILDNLRIGNPIVDMDEIGRASQQAGVEEFIKYLPDGYDTKVGSGGRSLSSGQIQRIALARALLKSSPLWLLDEPTAHLDVDSERWFMEVLENLPPSQTVLIISHRKQTLEFTNKVFFIRNGQVSTISTPVDVGEFKEFAQS